MEQDRFIGDAPHPWDCDIVAEWENPRRWWRPQWGARVALAELYDIGLGFDPAWQPLLANVSPSTVQSGSVLEATGSRFKGISEASGGNVSKIPLPTIRWFNC